jgi:hypothetical protein
MHHGVTEMRYADLQLQHLRAVHRLETARSSLRITGSSPPSGALKRYYKAYCAVQTLLAQLAVAGLDPIGIVTAEVGR